MRHGQIELESGTWNWQLTELRGRSGPHRAGERNAGTADPDPDADESGRNVLLLEDPEHPGDWMTCDLDPTAEPDGIPDEEVASLAREPELRQLTDPEGKVWSFEALPRPESVERTNRFDRPSARVRASSGGGPARVVPLPRDATLGTLTHEELLGLVKR
jgi:hypothetical protein